MATWDHGYVTDVVYTSNFYRETTPIWLATASLLLGQRPPDITRPFRYADLGCAHGFTCFAIAAIHPHAEVWGFDFNPAHIESARHIAAEAGLANAHFEEASFADLAARPKEALPSFDFMVSHGVMSWISPENRSELMRVIGQRLRPGGLSYLSYNVTTGWAGFVPLRRLMVILADASPDRTDQTVPVVMDFIDRMKTAGAAFFNAYPAVENRLCDIRSQDPRYIAHEFLNRDWHPLMFADINEGMTEARCSYIGSATLSENIDAVSVPANMVAMVNEQKDQVLRETLRDLGSSQAFRRDIYRRGVGMMSAAEHQSLLHDMTIAWTGVPAGEQVTINTPIGQLTGRPELYKPLLTMVEQGPIKIRDAAAREPFAGRSILELLQAVTLLIAGGYVHPMIPGGLTDAARESAARFNATIVRMNSLGGDIPRFVPPALGSAQNVDLLETLVVGELIAGKPAEAGALADAAVAALARSGRSVQKDGQAVSNPVEARTIITSAVQAVLERRLPLLRTFGVVA